MLETDFIPAVEKSNRLMVVLHGLGDSLEGYRWLPPALELPWLNYLLVNAPDPYYGGFSWYDYAGNPAPGIERSRQLLFELLDRQRAGGFPAGETVLFGFSQGCLMAIEVGCRYGHRFNGVVGISGYVHEPENLIKQFAPEAPRQRFHITHGFQDPVIPFAGARGQIRQLKAAGLNIDWREYEKAHTIAGEEELSALRDFVAAGYSRAR